MNDAIVSIMKLALAGLKGDPVAKIAAVASIEGLLKSEGEVTSAAVTTGDNVRVDNDVIRRLMDGSPLETKPAELPTKVTPAVGKVAAKADIVTMSTASAVVETLPDRSSALRAVFDKIAQLYESGSLPPHGWLPANAMAESRYRIMSKTDKNRPDDVILHINLHNVAGTAVRVVPRKYIVDVVRRNDVGAIAERARLYMPDSPREFEKTIALDGATYLERLNREYVGEPDVEPT